MTWLAPWALFGGALGMLGIVAAHLLSRQRPRALTLATARFLPSGMLEATTVQTVPRDRWWMLLRLLIVALLAAGAAQPVLTGRKVPTRTVLLLDRTLPADQQRRALASLSAEDVVIPFDTAASVRAPAGVTAAEVPLASVSAALAALVRVRDSLAIGADEVRIAAASGFAATSLDPATPALRALLRDSIRVMPVTTPVDTVVSRGAISVRAEGDDPIAATALLLGDSVARVGTIIDRRATLDADVARAAEQEGVVVHWPTRDVRDLPSLQSITVGRTTWIAPFGRDTAAAPANARAVGWWADGSPAVWQRDVGRGCVLTVHAALPAAGDHTLSLAAQAWLRTLVRSCDRAPRVVNPAPDWFVAAPKNTATLAARQTLTSGLAPWLVASALALAVLELVLRTMKRV